MNGVPAHSPSPPERVIGVDVGGTKVSVAVLGPDGLSEPVLEHTDTSSAEALIEQIVRQVEAAAGGEAPAAVGVGLPSAVEWETGMARSGVNVPLADVPLRARLGERLGLAVFVDNDAACAALAEAHDDADRVEARHLVMLTLGTGVGGGVVIDGRVYRGATGASAELGHTLIAASLAGGPPAASERFPQPGSLEALASGRALDHLAAEAAEAHPDSALGRLRAAGREVAGPDAVAAAHEGDEAARAAIALLGARVGVGIANAINTFDPDVVAIGGGVSAAGELLLEPARRTARRFVVAGVGTRTEIRLARSGPQAGVRGAALLARQELARERGHQPVAA